VQTWLDAMTCKPVSKKTYLRTASALFKWAIRERYVDFDPSAEVRLAPVQHRIRPWLQHGEWPAFLAGCTEHHRVRAEFVLHTGLRAGELCAAEHSWLHATSGRQALTVPKMKSKHPRAIPLSKRAEALLDEARRLWGEGGRIFGPEGFKGDNLRDNTVTACKRAKITVVDFHGLRRSCGAHWISRGVPLLHVSRLLGHADVSTTARHYAGIADGTLAAEIDRVELADEVST
jgi:integrase